MCNSEYASKQLNKIRNRINQAAKNASREPSEISLVGASKQQSSDLMAKFAEQGLFDFGENYLQEGLAKQVELTSSKMVWHYIGKVQSNKTRSIAEHFDWVHAVDRLKIAKRLALHRAASTKESKLSILIQVDIDNEPTKGGVPLQQALPLSDQIAQLEGIELRGLMLIPRARSKTDEQRTVFAKARELLEAANQRYALQMDTLSMGMSGDLEAAILEGSTMVRIGTDLFGPRD